jgi:hypothetical protein
MKENKMSGKCRPSLIKSIPYKLEGSNLSVSARECILEVFKRYQEMRPCKIGDTVWCIRPYKGIKRPQKGIVSEMFFMGESMELCIVVKKTGRGKWGEKIFPTEEAALNAIKEENNDLRKDI